MPENHGWIYRVLRLVTKDEVKTPLAFLFKVSAWLVAALIAILYAPLADDLKVGLVRFVFFSYLALSFVVLIFAWVKPKNLVYGETGYRGEHKLEYGTESRSRSKEELQELPSSSEPSLPQLEHK